MKMSIKTFFLSFGILMLTPFVVVADGVEIIDGYRWIYQINGDYAEIYNKEYWGSTAISPKPTGVVTIPSTLGGKPVKSIGRRAFHNCSDITNVKIPSSVVCIGEEAFSGCSGLQNVTIPAGVTNIGESAFYSCSCLASITIPNSVTSIGKSAFDRCYGLTSVIIPASVTSVGTYAFFACSNIRDVTIPGWRCEIPFDSVKNVVISEGTSCVRERAFENCSGVQSVTIPNSVITIGNDAFSDCGGMMSFSVAADNPFYKSINGVLLTKDGKSLIHGVNGNVIIPNGVTCIGNYAFYKCKGLTGVSIPDSITNIGNYAFYDCIGLTNISIPDGVTGIGSRAFFSCNGLTSVAIGKGLVNVEPSAFSGCGSLKSFVISDNNPLFKSDAGLFLTRDNQTLVFGVNGDVVIPNGITTIGDSAFSGRSSLTSVMIPVSVTTIGSTAFSGCTGLTSMTIPNGVTSIGNDAFYECKGLEYVIIPDSVNSIGKWAFNRCSSLTSIIIFGNPTLGRYVFANCGTNAVIYLSQSYNGTIDTFPEDVPILRFRPQQVVNFDVAGGVDDIADVQVIFGAQYGLLPLPSRIGYTFNGWVWNSQAIAADSVVSALDNHTLVAQWEVNQYKITFNANGGIGGQSVTQDYGTSFFAPIVTRTGYTFTGWSPEVDETVPASNVTYTAQWKIDQSVITSDARDYGFTAYANAEWVGDSSISHDGGESLRSGVIDKNQSSWLEATVSGAGRISFWWKASSEYWGKDIFDYAYLSVDGVPQGTWSNRRLSGVAIGGATDWTNVIVDVVGEGSHVIRWTYCKDEEDDGECGQDCVWLDEFSFLPKPTISFDIGSSAIGNAPSSIQEFAGTEVVLPCAEDICWVDHVFSGWSDGVNVYAGGVDYVVPSSNVTLTAYWRAKSFVSFDIGDGTGDVPETMKALPNETVTLPTGDGLSLTDHVFNGWTDGAVNYAAGADYVVPETNVTLAAIWIAKRFLTFTLNGGDGEIPIMIKDVPNATVTLPGGEGLHKAKHTFVGWSDGTQTYDAGAEYVVTDSSVEFTAVWTANRLVAPAILCAGVANGGTVETASATIEITADSGTAIYYTLDGSEPTTNSIPYAAPFVVDGMEVTIKALAVKDDYFDSPVSEFAFSRKPYSAAECINAYGKAVSTGNNDAAWVRVLGDNTHDGVAALRSGVVGEGGSSSVEMSVDGAGEIGFWWKASCERVIRGQPKDHVAFYVDGVSQCWMGGLTDWSNVVVFVSGEGLHVLKWVYQKDSNEKIENDDCAWLDEVTWTPWNEVTTKQTMVPIPYGWLDSYGLLSGNDPEMAAKQPTGKRDGRGRLLTVEDDFIAGTDPTNENDVFSVSISMSNGFPVVEWRPNLNTNGVNRVYTIYGKATLDEEWTTPTNALSHFFKVEVAMPSQNKLDDTTGGNDNIGSDTPGENGDSGEEPTGDDSGPTENPIPAGYSTNGVSCVTCTGSEWYDLGLPPTLTMKVQIKHSYAGEWEHTGIIGAMPQSGNDISDWRLFVANGPQYRWYLDYPGASGGARIYGGSAALNAIYEIEFGNFYVKDIPSNAVIISGASVIKECPSNNICLFKINYAYPERIATGCVYYVKIYDMNASGEYELVRNLVPCKPDNAPAGLLDLIEMKFYKNNGTWISLAQ